MYNVTFTLHFTYATDRSEVLYNNHTQFRVFIKLEMLVTNVSRTQIFVCHLPYTKKRKRRLRFVPWSLALMEEHRLSIFENTVLRRIFRLRGTN